MNNTILKFLERHDFDLSLIKKKCDLGVKSSKDVNPIIAKYYIGKGEAWQKIYVADIVGYDYRYMNLDNSNIIDNMSYFYNENGDGYSTRSLSLLDIPTDEIVYRLMGSFTRDPMYLMEADKGRYVIDSNGLHRLHILKAHYLKELSELDKGDAIGHKILEDKYTIETMVRQVDYLKTYSSFLFQRVARFYDCVFDIIPQYDDYGELTGNVTIELSGKNEKLVLNDKQFIKLLKDEIANFLKDNSISKKDKKQFIDYVGQTIEKYASFKEYIKQNLQEIYNQYFYDEVEVSE